MIGLIDSHPVRSGQARLEVRKVFGESTVTSASASSPTKILTPVSRGKSVWAYTSSFGGGLVAGDQTELHVIVGRGARCFLSTQSATKVYRNPTRLPCSHTTHAVVEEESLLVFAPDPVQGFAGSRYCQRQQFHLASHAGLVLLDWFTAGRAARGERWAFSHYESRNDVFISGQKVVADPLLLRPPDLARQMGRFNCLATLLLMGAPLATAAAALSQSVAAQPVEKRAAVVFCASPVSNGVVVRIAGMEVETVRRGLQHHLEFISEWLGDNPWTRKW